jgi:hypothetical protein
MALFDEARVDATPLLVAWNQLAVENERVGNYHAAANFWDTYGKMLTGRRDIYQQHRTDMEANTQWKSPAAQEFYGRVDAGVTSIDSWQPAALPGVATKFRAAADAIGPAFQTVNENRDMLSGNGSVWTRFLQSGGGEIPTFRMEGNTVVVSPAGHEAWARQLIGDAERTANEVAGRFTDVLAEMDRTMRNHQEWKGPIRAQVADPRRGGPRGGPGGPSAPGGPGGGPPPGGPGGPGADKPGETPGGPAGPGSTPDTGAPGGPSPAGDPTAGDPGTPDTPGTTPPPMTSDPELAGTPTATLNPTSNPTSNPALNPLPGSTPSTSIPPSSLPGGNLSTTPVPFTPVSSARPPLPGGLPNRADSTVDGLRGTVPGQSVPAAAEQQVRPRGGTPAGSSSSTGAGFYPPMMPMYPPQGGGSGSGIRPGEAEFAGGPIRHNGGRESWRAGLRPDLLGRADERDDEPQPVQPVANGEVLDEELWQVPGAAPATPPEPQQRRGRSWP